MSNYEIALRDSYRELKLLRELIKDYETNNQPVPEALSSRCAAAMERLWNDLDYLYGD